MPVGKKIIAVLTSPSFLRVCSGYMYFHFGFLKFFVDLSPAELLAEQTILILTFGYIGPATSLVLLAVFECVIGLCLLFKFKLKWVFPIFVFHMLMTFAPLIILPELCFRFFPLAPTLEGLFILKNVPLMAAVWVVLHPMAFGRRGSEETSRGLDKAA